MDSYKLQELAIHDDGTTEWVTLAYFGTQEAAVEAMDDASCDWEALAKLRVLRPDDTECASFNPPVVP